MSRIRVTHLTNHCFNLSCLVSIPVSVEILDRLGPRNCSILTGGFLAIALVAFMLARWFRLGSQWRWKAIV